MAKSDKKQMQQTHPGVGLFLMTYVGAAIYFVDKADGFWEVVLALLQALVWPAYVVNHVLTVFHI